MQAIENDNKLHINSNIKNRRKLWKNLKINLKPSKSSIIPSCIGTAFFLDIPGGLTVSTSQLLFFESNRFGSGTLLSILLTQLT